MTYWYLGSPYSKYPAGLRAAQVEACRAAGLLIRAKVPVFSPIAHSHSIAVIAGIDPHDHAIWLPADKPLMEAAHGLIVLQLDDWGQSVGLRREIQYFLDHAKPIVYMAPGLVPRELKS